MKPSKPRGECGDLIRRHREAAGLSQEALAERAGISPRGLLYLERGTHRPYPDTLNRLANALALTPQERAALAQAARPAKSSRPTSTKSGASTPSSEAAPPATEDMAEPPAGRGAVGQVATVSAGPLHNLPASLSSFIGREHAQARVRDLLASHRLVTLVGAGGVGKTRLAMAVAAASLGAYPDGVWLVELAALDDPGLVPGAVAEVLGLREEPGRPVLETLRDYCGGKRLLLVLDNCEHLLAACAALAGALLRAAPDLRILATSREALGVAGERRYRVPSLSVPDPEHLPSPDLAGSYEAVRLFVARAQERRDTFALTTTNARAVAEICAQLDGLPLAIELAAARIAAMSVAMIAAHLHDRFRLLTTGSGDLPTRQRTLRATLDWSWDLLDAPERTLLSRFSVFAGGWTLEAASAVCSGAGVEAPEILDLLSGLVEKSLVQGEAREGRELRYGLLETVRQYTQARLAADGLEPLAGRHLEWCLALAEESALRRRALDQGSWWEGLETEHDNLRSALGWATARPWSDPLGSRVRALRLAGLLSPFWEWRGHVSEGRRWLDLALAGAGADVPATARVLALNGAAALARQQGDLPQARAWSEDALALARAAGDMRGCATALTTLGISAAITSDFARAQTHFEDALAACRQLDDVVLISRVLSYLGNVAGSLRDFAQANRFNEESLALARARGDTAGIAAALHNLAWSALEQREYERAASLYEEVLVLHRLMGNRHHVAHALIGLGNALQHGRHDLELAQAHVEESLAIFEELGDRWNSASARSCLGALALERGHYVGAGWWLAESLRLFMELGERRNTATTLIEMAELAAARGQQERAARLVGAGEALHEATGLSAEAAREKTDRRVLAMVRGALGEDAFSAAWADGRAMPLDDAVALALEGTETLPQR